METSRRARLVVGGGIIGLATAFRLAEQGAPVTLFDPTPARGATWAAAGMLAASAEIAPGERDNYEIQRTAVPAWERLATDLQAVAGQSVQVHHSGSLLVGWDASDRRLVSQFASVANEFCAPCESVTRTSHPAYFEGLSDRIHEGHLLREDAWLDPDEAVSALVKGCEQRSVKVIRERVEAIASNEHGVTLETSGGQYEGSLGVLATGASPLPPGELFGGYNKVRPVRGLTTRVVGLDRSAQPMIRAFVKGHMFYMVSRPGGYCVLGATSDEKDNATVEVGELARLLRDALDVVPSLETATLVENRAGLRPANVDHRHFFEVSQSRKWAWSSGHYRHGVTMAPLAAMDAVAFAGGAS